MEYLVQPPQEPKEAMCALHMVSRAKIVRRVLPELVVVRVLVDHTVRIVSDGCSVFCP